jgi:hypothetical protein
MVMLLICGACCLMAGCATATSKVHDLDAPSVTLVGSLVVEVHYGPPNYGETPEVDRLERAYVLVLDEPVTVVGDTAAAIGADNPGTISRIKVSKVQLAGVLYCDPTKNLVGRRIQAIGKLFPSHTGHHYTRILLDVEENGIRAHTALAWMQPSIAISPRK